MRFHELHLRVKETTVQVCLCPRGKIDKPLAYTHVRNGELSEQVAAAVARLVEVAERAKKTEDAKNAKESK